MRRRLALIGLVLVLIAVAGPAAAAVVVCQQDCFEGNATGADECGDSECCSCCPHARFTLTGPAAPPLILAGGSRIVAPVTARFQSAEPRGILHVPKPLPA